MSDKRHCDGPHCDQSVSLDEDRMRRVGDMGAENYITLERPVYPNLHFHSQQCLNDWAKENTRVSV